MPDISNQKNLVSVSNSADRLLALLIAAIFGVILVVVLNLAGPLQIKGPAEGGAEIVRVDLSRILVDWTYYQAEDGTVINERNFFSVQAFMWVAMFIGLGDLFLRWRALGGERRALSANLLPEDERTVLQAGDLRPYYLKARSHPYAVVLPTLIRRLTMDFRKSRDTDRTNALLDSSLELMLHQLDLRYTLLRYVVWLIPTLGFVGTVIGIANAMAFAGSGAVAADALLSPTTQKLAVAFYTTLLALLQSSVLVWGMQSVQAGEEGVINQAGEYCLENLVMRLMEPEQLGNLKQTGSPA